MPRTAQPRFVTDFRLVIEIAADDENDALARLEAVQSFVAERLDRSTFKRLPGRPEMSYSDFPADVVPL